MKLLLLIITIMTVGCSRKYQTFHIIEKSNFKFNEETEQNLITKKLYPGRKIEKDFCSGQVLWMNNALNETQTRINEMVRYSCEDSNYILNSKITETWWTTLFYTKSCIKLETYCPRNK